MDLLFINSTAQTLTKGSMLNTTTESRFLPVKDSIALPVFMFCLGVCSNGFAIICLRSFLRGIDRNSLHSNHGSPRLTSDVIRNAKGLQAKDGPETRPTGSPCGPGSGYGRTRHKMKLGSFHALVLTLAFLDLLGTLCTSPVTIILYANNSTILAYGGDTLCSYSAFTMMFFGFTTAAMVMTMSVERVLSVRFPYFYHSHANAKKAGKVALVVIVFGALLCLLPVFGFGEVKAGFPFTYCFADWTPRAEIDKAFNHLYVVLGSLMLLVTLICNVFVIQGLIAMNKGKTSSFIKRKRTLSYETQMIIQLLFITTIMFICWLPLLITMTFHQLFGHNSNKIDRVAIWLVCVNPILDPWVYILCRQSVIKGAVEKIKGLLCTRIRAPKVSLRIRSEDSRLVLLTVCNETKKMMSYGRFQYPLLPKNAI